MELITSPTKLKLKVDVFTEHRHCLRDFRCHSKQYFLRRKHPLAYPFLYTHMDDSVLPANVNDPIRKIPEVDAASAMLGNASFVPDQECGRFSPNEPVDVFSALEYMFGFQKDNTRNQREHLLLLLANSQLRLLPNTEPLPSLAEATSKVCDKVLYNYQKWCMYMKQNCIYSSRSCTPEQKLLLVALYLCIWGEAANIRFLPECICYIYHNMAKELPSLGSGLNKISLATCCNIRQGKTFLERVIKPIYEAIKKESEKGRSGKSHSKWSNYDDFNEYFWSRDCFKDIGWPFEENRSLFFKSNERTSSFGKMYFVEHRTFFHLYHSFHRLWIFLVMMFQVLVIIAQVTEYNFQTLVLFLSLGLTYFIMKLFQSVLDILLMVGAHRRSGICGSIRRFTRVFFFGGCVCGLFYLYVKIWRERDSNSLFFKIYVLVLGSYVGVRLLIGFISCGWRMCFRNNVSEKDISGEKHMFCALDVVKKIYQDRYYVGQDLDELFRDKIRYVMFWAILLGCKFVFSYFFQIKPLMDATPLITSFKQKIQYTWHDFVSQNNHNALAVFFLWAPVVLIYLLDISIWYAIFSAILGGIIGARDRLGEIRIQDMLRTRFHTYPKAFVNLLQSEKSDVTKTESDELGIQKEEARKFAPFWNDIIEYLWKENYINVSEKGLLIMPPQDMNLEFVQWPLFLLVGKVSLAVDLITEQKENPEQQWVKVYRDQYMFSAMKEVILSGCMMVQKIVEEEKHKNYINQAINILKDEIGLLEGESKVSRETINNIGYLVNAIRKLTIKLSKSKDYLQELNNVFERVHPFMSKHGHSKSAFRLTKTHLSSDQRTKPTLKRLDALLNEDYASTIPKNIEARRRLQFFTNSLFMNMPFAPTVRAMNSFSVLTPYYDEPVIYSKKELMSENEDGITILFYLQKIFPDEWDNFLGRIKMVERPLMEKLQHEEETKEIKDLRLWASYRGQTLARTVRGIMYYREALIKQRKAEAPYDEHPEAYADIKFSYVVSCQKYGEQIEDPKNGKGRDILHLMEMYPSLRVAYVHEEGNEYFSKLVKGIPGDTKNKKLSGDTEKKKHQEIYSIKLPGNPILGEGKPENQNHALIFTRGFGLQTIDMNQDNSFEEALKMRNLLEEFSKDHGRHSPTILGVRENIFTGSVSSLAWFMSNQETSFVTLGQRVLARPLKVRMHYGHPDVFDRIFHITRGGISKASKSINVSEDIFAGFNSTLRGGNITHHEYIQVGKGRDVGLNQIALFEAKVSGGNGEQSLSRDVYRLGQFLEFFRMLSLYFTSVGYYVCTMMTVLVVYVFLYGRAYLALSGIEKPLEIAAKESKNKALQSTLDAEFLIQIGIFSAIPMLVVFILEQGVLKAIVSFISMQLQLCSVFFTFSMGTRAHYFGKTILAGGAKYRPTGRGFVVNHIKFAENYRLYSRSHFLKAIEIAMLLLVYLAYGYKSSSVSYILLSFGSWMLVISWLFAPAIFNPSGFEWQKTVDDFDDWVNWLLSRGSQFDSESWEVWWGQQANSTVSISGRVLETIISLRFFVFQYGVVYHLHAVQGNTSISVYGISWLVLLGIIVIFKVFSFRPKDASWERSLRLLRVILFIVVIIFLVVMILVTPLTVGDIFASLLAFIPTGWGILCIGIAWRGVMEKLQLWSALRGIARFYDAAIGAVIFTPVVILSWFPFVSTFQTRLLYNQAFSRGLEISLILSGNRPATAT